LTKRQNIYRRIITFGDPSELFDNRFFQSNDIFLKKANNDCIIGKAIV